MNNSIISKNLKKEFRYKIHKWSEENIIDYPWRKERNPYKVLISEVLLTRTKAQQVKPVFIEFMKRYPDLETFLELDLKIVEEIIKSLGLIKRAEMIEKISLDIINKFDRKIPDDLSRLKSLKGIGDYGANAILCFAYNQKRPLLDSNFIRIYARVFNIKPKTKTAKTDKFLWEFSEKLLPEEKYIEFNYGVLDLGGSICQKKPKCYICPLNSLCFYYKNM